jgi:hypothetical protein
MCLLVEVFSDNLGVSEVSGLMRGGVALKGILAGDNLWICCIAGSGSTYVYGYCDATYKDKMNEEETVTFVKNSKFDNVNCRSARGKKQLSLPIVFHNSLVSRHEP